MYKVQSVIFDKKKFSLHLSKEWLKHHGYKDKGLDDKDRFYRFRQFNPTTIQKQGFVEFRTKKLGKSGVELIIAYKEPKTGGAISNEDLHHFIYSSYENGKAYKDWKLDKSLSDKTVQVYSNNKGQAIVVHRGSHDLQDWKENALLALGFKSGMPRLEHSREIQKKAEQKYGANNVTTIGHSKGAFHAEEVGQNSKEIFTLNKPVTPYDIIYGKTVPEKQTDIKTGYDPVSILRPFQKGKEYEHIKSETGNPLTEHLPGVLKRVNPFKWWGKGLKTGGMTEEEREENLEFFYNLDEFFNYLHRYVTEELVWCETFIRSGTDNRVIRNTYIRNLKRFLEIVREFISIHINNVKSNKEEEKYRKCLTYINGVLHEYYFNNQVLLGDLINTQGMLDLANEIHQYIEYGLIEETVGELLATPAHLPEEWENIQMGKEDKSAGRLRGGGAGSSTLDHRRHWKAKYNRLLTRIKKIKKPQTNIQLNLLRLKFLELVNERVNNEEENNKIQQLIYIAIANRHLEPLEQTFYQIIDTLNIPPDERLTFNDLGTYDNYDELIDNDENTIEYGSGRGRELGLSCY